jgi:translation elongation factor EF-1beta
MDSNLAYGGDVSRELQTLGDPSGRQDSHYWDEWFDIVCRKQNHRTFEWYCSADEVLRVIRYHLQHQLPANYTGDHDDSILLNEYVMIHPGSGTSILPITLSNVFRKSRQVVVDISEVAIIEIQSIHESEQNKTFLSQTEKDTLHRPIDYIVSDLLNDSTDTSANFGDSTFDCWIDKGFVDAIFSDKNESTNEMQSKRLFQEANRILKGTTGFMITISIGEEHSLQIIISNWLRSNFWEPVIHIWELQPISGNMPPFAFVFHKLNTGSNNVDGRLTIQFHPIKNTGVDIETEFSNATEIMERIHEIVIAARKQFSLSLTQRKSIENTSPRLLATIDIKPFDAEIDLIALGKTIQDQPWSGGNKSIQVQWQSFSDANGEEEWLNIVPIGYGISKLQLRCIVNSDDLDELVSSIEAWDTDVVQSVDVDWSQTVPISSLDHILRK